MADDSCPDCGVPVGARHDGGCDVARCKECGGQALMCRMLGQHTDVPTTVWTGEWPGDVECRELDLWVSGSSVMRPPIHRTGPDDPDRAEDLNELTLLHARGVLRWDKDLERLVRW